MGSWDALLTTLDSKLSEAGDAPVVSRWCPQLPTPPQKLFVSLNAPEALYGGAAGGGKSSALLMDALRHVDVPGYSAILFRRTLTDLSLPEGLMDRAGTWLRPTAARWHGDNKSWSFPSGARLVFGYLDAPYDHERYQGAAFQYVGFDELTQIRPSSYEYLFSRNRKLTDSDITLKMRAASNPGGRYHSYVYNRFVGPSADKSKVVFVPAKLTDNPHINQAEYVERLKRMDDITRAQLLDGLWVTDTNGRIYPITDAMIVDDCPYEPSEMQHVLGVDLGTREDKPTTSYCIVSWYKHDDVAYVTYGVKSAGDTPYTIADEIKELEETFTAGGFVKVVMDAGGLGKGYIDVAQQRHKMRHIEPAEKNDKLGYRKLLRGAMERGEVKFLRPSTRPLVDELENLHWDDTGTKEAKGSDNHCSDSFLYAWRASMSYLATEAAQTPKLGDGEAYEKLLEEQALERLERKNRKDEIWL